MPLREQRVGMEKEIIKEERYLKSVDAAQRIAQAVKETGGRAFYVGGCVRDTLMDRPGKDIDIEVHGVSAEKLEAILQGIGPCRSVGKSFGIYSIDHLDLDIALPRKEHCTGKGHKDIAVSTDPYLGYEKAAQRRDFTVNAMMQDILTGEILDYFGGRKDLEMGIIRHVEPMTFADDPLRVLRAAQFAARFGFSVAEDTIDLAKKADLNALASERIAEELKKALLRSEKPSVFFEVLRKMDQGRDWFKPVFDLIGVPQDPSFHSEGDAWTHTLLVLDAAASERERAEEPYGFMLSALLHDIGKSVTVSFDGKRIHAFGHEQAGAEMERELPYLKEKKLLRYVQNMTLLHMRPNMMVAQNSSDKGFCRLFDESVCPEDLLLIAKADHLGRGSAKPYKETEALLRKKLAIYRERMALPCVTGDDLLQNGFAPGKIYAEALALGHKLQLAGIPKQEALKAVINITKSSERKKLRKPGASGNKSGL